MAEERLTAEQTETCEKTTSKVSDYCGKLLRLKPHGFTASVITKVHMMAVMCCDSKDDRTQSGVNRECVSALLGLLLFGVVWSVTGSACLPGQNLFGLVILLLSAVCGGKLISVFRLPRTPPIPALLGMLLAGVVLRNVPYITDAVYIDQNWSAALRNISLAVILTRAGLGLNAAVCVQTDRWRCRPQKHSAARRAFVYVCEAAAAEGFALRRLKAVCVRVAVGPCLTEACTVAVVSHFLLELPWIWSFMLGFVLAAVSPAVVVPSMLLLQSDGFGVQKGVPTLLMAAGSFDDILAITGFTTCLGIAFGTGSTWMNVLKGVLEVLAGVLAGGVMGLLLHFLPSEDQSDVVLRRCCLLLGLSVFSVFGSRAAGLGGAGGLCTLVLAFIAGLSWKEQKVKEHLQDGVQRSLSLSAPVAAVVGRFWDVFQPLLFGLIGAEINISSLSAYTVGLGVSSLCVGLLVRVLVTFCVVLFAGFNMKEKIFISLAWMPKATVQAAIGSTALDMARSVGDEQLQNYGMDVLTVAVLAILITAPIGALAIGLSGPKLLQQETHTLDGARVDGLESKL
ncbi:Sodium/hydrogen exchanger 9B2 [Labeo rohita]|uniref:Sodium/hydrogen exchanger 9B2 n=2 Tax=Labeonini TaxID=2743697 RepID=A0ABQ8KZR0_LABRO|nr:Sodium/hydrogen exchanger 9B2 [Labeo rohita]